MAVYYLNRAVFRKGDLKTAFAKAASILKEDRDIDTITFLVYQAMHYDSFLGEMNFTKQHYKTHIARMGNYKVQVHTVKTYSPEYQFQGHPQSEMLIAVGVPPKQLERFEDYSNIKYWVIVPWQLDEYKEWLSIFEGIDIETGQVCTPPAPADERIANAIGWLRVTSYPNEGCHHPLDVDRLHEMSNALKHYKVPFNYASTMYCAMHTGLIPSAALNTAEAFMRAQTRAFALRHSDSDYAFMKDMMETKHDRS